MYLCKQLEIWTHLKAVSLVHQEPLPLGGVSHLLCILWHQWIEVCIVLLSHHTWKSREGQWRWLWWEVNKKIVSARVTQKQTKTFFAGCPPFLARRTLPSLWASCLLEPPWEEIWIRTLASGKSNEVSPTCAVEEMFLTSTDGQFIVTMKLIHWVYTRKVSPPGCEDTLNTLFKSSWKFTLWLR